MDLIDREQTIAHLKKRLIETAINNVGIKASCDSIFVDIADNRIEPWINEIPLAEKTGNWIYEGERGRFPACRCSVCGNKENADWAILGNNVNYCPNCGARMVKE